MRHPIIAIAAAVVIGPTGTALAEQPVRPAPGEVAVSVVNGRMNAVPKRFSTPEYLAEAQARRDARESRAAIRQAERSSREHGVAVRDGRLNFAPKAPVSMMAITDQ